MNSVSINNKAKNQVQYTYSISLKGLVQGVGFRPFVYQLANNWGLKGQVRNGLEGVEIIFNTDATTAQNFYQQVLFQAPSLAQIDYSILKHIDNQFFEDFSITESTSEGKASLLLAPDFAMCHHCRLELDDTHNKRYRYPFISCTNCGPRYSIITKLPYDRPQTTMADFAMCEACLTEYHNPNDRRFYAQTNSCNVCGPKLGWYKTIDGQAQAIAELYDSHWILSRVKWALEAGNILAVKGIGGYLLMCDATNESAVNKLRTRKNRPTKPFAVLFPDIKLLEKEVFIHEKEKEALQSTEAPIVLLKQRPNIGTQIAKGVNPNLDYIGAMLPYTPILSLIAYDLGKPLVATSGNVSGSPIIFEDEKALSELSPIVDYILTNNRRIIVPQDDTVIRFSEKYQQKILIRRSRGNLLVVKNKAAINSDTSVSLGFGASLKSTFSIQNTDNFYVSQYLGDLESYETQQNFERVLHHFATLFEHTLTQSRLFCDAHEGYFSTSLAQRLAQQWHIPVTKIQHHQAHFAAILAEHNLNDNTVMGVIWDGTGYGTDGNMWGGEFFIQQERRHFDYFDAILGDKMPREPRISALCLTYPMANVEPIIQPKFTVQEWLVYHKILERNIIKTSSVGRIFDGVASLLGLCEKQSFEGQAAMLLEELAGRYLDENGYDFGESYWTKPFSNIPTKQLIEGILQDIAKQKSDGFIAAKFHFSLVESVRIVAEQYQIKKIAFSGGVFQNAVLVDLLRHYLQANFQLFFHQKLSPNDENISFGQINFHKCTEYSKNR